MKKQDLARLVGLSDRTIAKMGKGESVTVDVIARICNALNCTSADIMEITPDSAKKPNKEGDGSGE
jgi:DNA-binding Xre family transcriptional regulator